MEGLTKLDEPSDRGRWPRWRFCALLVGTIFLANANSFHVPFVYDDVASIPENPTLRHLWSSSVWSPPPGTTVSGRPVLNATLAINYACGELNVRGYHLTNLILHGITALLVFALLRRTFRSPRLERQFEGQGDRIAFFGAALWALHPLQTESVTYVVQRAESLMGLFYVLTLYGFVRGTAATTKPSALGWYAASVAAVALGMGTKEAMITAPILVLLYDGGFGAPSLRAAINRRWRVHALLCATAVLLGYIAWQGGARSGTAGLSAGVKPWQYALAQTRAIFEYVRLTVWPYPQIFDHGPFRMLPVRQYLASATVLGLLVCLALALHRRFPKVVWALGVFVLILLPTSSLLPIVTEPIAEHRLYLPLAAVIPLVVAGGFFFIGRAATAIWLVAMLALGVLTFARNAVYRSEESLWTTTVQAAPANSRAHYCLALSLLGTPKNEKRAEAELRTALAVEPKYLAARLRLAELLSATERASESANEYQTVLRDYPDNFVAHNALGLSAFESGDLTSAAKHLERALQSRPKSAVAHNNLGGVLYEMGDFAGAAEHERTALTLDPNYAEAAYNLGNALARQNHPLEAKAAYERALGLNADYAAAHANLAAVLVQLRQRDAAIQHYRAALKLRPDLNFVRERLAQLGSAELAP